MENLDLITKIGIGIICVFNFSSDGHISKYALNKKEQIYTYLYITFDYFSEESATFVNGLLDITGKPLLFQLQRTSFDLSSYLIQSIYVTVFLVALSSHTTHQRKIGYSAKGRVFLFFSAQYPKHYYSRSMKFNLCTELNTHVPMVYSAHSR
jgi:hypothetical protein